MFTNRKNKTREINVEGMMSFGQLENGLHRADFACCEDIEMEPFTAQCKVQVMRDGNVYITERPKKEHNKPLFRENNSSLTLGRDGKFYFVFTLPAEQMAELPEELITQASLIAQKVIKVFLSKL